MKILTKKNIDDILKRIAANEIIVIECDISNDIEAQTQLAENNADIAYIVGGTNGMAKVRNTVHKRYDSEVE